VNKLLSMGAAREIPFSTDNFYSRIFLIPSTAAGFHHKLGEVYLGAHPVLNISGPFHRLTGNITQPPRGKDSEYTEQMSTPSPQPNSCSLRSGKSDRDIGGRSPCHLARPPPLQIPTNTAHKVPADISRQLRDTHVFEQQCSSRTTVVAPECCNRKRQCDQSSSHRPIHNMRRLQNRLRCVVRELNRKRPLVASGSQTTHKRPRIESGLSCRQPSSRTGRTLWYVSAWTTLLLLPT